MRSRDQRCAAFTLETVLAMRGRPTAADFRKAAEELPALLRTNGLGQAAAYLKGKDPSLYEVLQDWLLEEGDLVDAVCHASRDQYMEAVESAWRLSEWLKPLAVAYLPGSEPR